MQRDTETDDRPEQPEPEAEPSFTVRDRRWWAQDDGAQEQAAAEDRKPAYIEGLEAQLREKDERLQETLARHRDALEEFERAKTRVEREAKRELERSRRDILRGFVEVVDDLDRALEAARAGAGAGGQAITEGIELVSRRFLARLAEHGVERIDPQGAPFDPSQHEAASMVPAQTAEQDNTVVGVVKPGYRVGDQVLRPALVAVGRFSGERAS